MQCCFLDSGHSRCNCKSLLAFYHNFCIGTIARLYLSEGSGKVNINGKELKEYFPVNVIQYKFNQPFLLTQTEEKFDIAVRVTGGGVTGQVDAIRLAISKALVKYNEEFRSILKPESLLTRDARVVERKKYGQKKARKKFQFSKR